MDELRTSPGWIDIHAHIAGFSKRGGVDAVQYGTAQGVGTLVDAGSAPPAELPELLTTAAGRPTRVLAWANICAEGIAGADCTTHDMAGEAADLALRECPGRVIGIKLQASHTRLAGRALEALGHARRVAERHAVPLLVHVGNAPPTLEDVLEELRAGDIVTHFAHGKRGGMLENGRIIPAATEARGRGVLFDLGHGAGSFSFDVMEQLMALGFPPNIISTDLHAGSAKSPVGSLADCMSKLVALRMPLDDVVAAVTTVPSKALGIEPHGSTRFRVESQVWEARDSYGNSRTLGVRIVPDRFEVNA